MKREEIKVCVLRVGGTNCDTETKRALQESKMRAEIIHFNRLGRQCSLLDYHVMVIPGGFSHGDYVRAGAIWATRLMAKLGKDIRKFVDQERPILGVCNGFQVLVEAGLLPKFDGIAPFPEASLGTNIPHGYNCRWVHLKHENRGRCIFTRQISSSSILHIPVAHSEGRFVFAKENEEKYLSKLLDNDQLVFRYCLPNGKYADGDYPSNPNGSFYDIAGICDSSGTIFGLMPHPERAYFGWQLPDWTKKGTPPAFGDGKPVFDSIAEYLARKF